MVTQRSSSSLCSSSGIEIARGSKKRVAPRSKLTRCLRRLSLAFAGSHSNSYSNFALGLMIRYLPPGGGSVKALRNAHASYEVAVCDCGPGRCFDGAQCVEEQG